jgi:hypothetical protein
MLEERNSELEKIEPPQTPKGMIIRSDGTVEARLGPDQTQKTLYKNGKITLDDVQETEEKESKTEL